MKKIVLIVCIILFSILIEPIVAKIFMFDNLELISYDMRSKTALDRGPFNKFKHFDKKIVIVAIDDYSKKQLADHPELKIGSWPWRRDVWVPVVDFIERGEPKALLFDLIFSDINYSYSYDADFANKLSEYDNIVLATSVNDPKALFDKLTPEQKEELENTNSYFKPTGYPLTVNIEDKKMDDYITYYSHAPIYNTYTTHNMMGVVNKVQGVDSVIRNSQPIFKIMKNGEPVYMPSLAFAGFLKYMGAKGDIAPIEIRNNKIFYKGRELPINIDGTIPISWHGKGSGREYEFVHISDILLNTGGEGELKPEYFKDKIVLIGRTETGTDIHPAAVNNAYPGTEVNATVIDNFINDTNPNNLYARKFISAFSPWNDLVLTVSICFLIVGISIASSNAFFSLFNSVLLIIIYVLGCICAFVIPSVRLWVPIIVPMYYMITTAIVAYSFKLQEELSKKAQIMGMFGKFVSPKTLNALLKTKEKDGLVLKNTKKHISIMFCDVKDFTTLSEKSNPEQLVENLNELFNEIVNIIFENDGTVDKFVGDCVMAYWGDPIASEDDAYMAVKTALEIKKKVNELKLKNIKEGKLVLDVKIGINTGDALLGLAGSDKIMSYTAMGDAVNTAARLEASCSRLERDVLISKATYEEAKDKIVAMNAGTISVKGKDEQITVYEPIGLVEDEASEDVEAIEEVEEVIG